MINHIPSPSISAFVKQTSEFDINVRLYRLAIRSSTLRRQQQLFSHYVGVSAKTYSRIVRLQSHSFNALMGKPIDTIIPEGYYDQAHYIHDFKELTGMLPGEYFNYILQPRNREAYLNSNLYFTG